jgi:hypothetical protein
VYIGTASIARSKTATAEAIFWQAIVVSAIRARTMAPTLQDTRAQRNAALAPSSSSTGHVDPREFGSGRSIDLDRCTRTIRLFKFLQGGIEMCPAQVNGEFEVTINETNVTAVHRDHKHKYFFPYAQLTSALASDLARKSIG